MTAARVSEVFRASRENGRRRPRGYADWRPQTKSVLRLDQVRDVLDEYRDHLPLTIRQVFYRLVATTGYEKTEAAYGRLAELLNRARRAREIPFDVIRDDGVITVPSEMYGDVEDFHDETARRARRYRRDRQVGQRQYIELWCEAAGMLKQLARAASDYSVPVYATGGFASLTANHELARRALSRNVPTVLLHVGDFDPSGESIFTAMSEDAAAFVAADRVIQSQRLNAVRVALTREQVEQYALPTAPAKVTDSRAQRWDGATCQLEALAPDQLAALVAETIEHLLDMDAYSKQVESEDRERAALLQLPRGVHSRGVHG